MNNDLEQFSEERLKELSNINGNINTRFCDADIAALARIALAAKQAKPVAYMYRDNLHSDARFYLTSQIGNWSSEEISEYEITEIPLYTTPQPAHTEQDGWKLVPEEATLAMLTLLGVTGSFSSMQQKYQNMLEAAPMHDGTLISEGTKNDSCQWNRDEDLVYSTGCGNEWQFTEGGLEDNKIKFCPYCSGKIAAPKPESEL